MLLVQLDNALRHAIRSSPLAPVFRRLFRRQPLDQAIRLGEATNWEAAANRLLSDESLPILRNKSLHDSLRYSINEEIPIELLLTSVRARLMLEEVDFFESSEKSDLVNSLIRQCLNNEFVWYVSEDERRAINKKLEEVGSGLSSGKQSGKIVAQLSMYMRPSEFLNIEQMAELELLADGMPGWLASYLTDFFADHIEETKNEREVKRFGRIENATSALIKENYKEYPYPRWIELGNVSAGERRDLLAEFFSDAELEFLDRPMNVLVAGCGTGSKAIEYGVMYGDNARILAIDLSRPSLAYAQKMARRLGVENVEFLQMDLLDVPNLPGEFDIVECTGVLHHMADPVEGGRAIISRVREGGLVHISLYSELARSEVVRLRKGHEDRIADITADDVRAYRRQWMLTDADAIDNRLCLRWDFFDLNRCKDLLFHPLEYRFTIPKIEAMLKELGLEFRGIERPDICRDRYWTRYPPRHRTRDFGAWDKFEQAHPSAFGSLYEIWARKTYS